MLKVKESVGLKELEKFGYVITYYDGIIHAIKSIKLDYNSHIDIHINNNNSIWFRKKIETIGFSASTHLSQKEFGFFKTRYYLKDLIKNKLIEKENENE